MSAYALIQLLACLWVVPTAFIKKECQEIIALYISHQSGAGVIFQKGSDQFHTQIFSIIKHVTVQELMLRNARPFRIHLIKEKVTQSIMDKTIIIKFHYLWNMRLTSTNDDRAGIRHGAEIDLLLRACLGELNSDIECGDRR